MSSQATNNNARTKFYIHCAIMFALMFIVSKLPPFGDITPLGMQVLGIFAGVIYAWCFLGFLWPSLLAMILLGCTEYCTVKEAFSAGMGDATIITLFCLFTFAAYMEESGLSRYIANWFISRKVGEGRPWMFTFLILLATYVLSSFVSLYATIVVMWGIFYNICDTIGIEKKSKYSTVMICGIAMVSSLTSLLFPFKVFSQVVYGLVVKATGMTLTIEFIPWFVYNFVLSFGITVIFLFAVRFIIRPDVTLVAEAGKKYAHLREQKMGRDEKVAFVILALFILSQLVPSFLPQTIPFVALLNNLGVLGCTAIALVAIAVLRWKNGDPVGHVGNLIRKGVNWDIVIMMAATMPLSAALESEKTGILTTIVSWMTTTFSDVSPTVFLFIIVIIFLAATQIFHNVVLMMIFIPMLAKLGLAYDIHPFVIGNLIYFCSQSAFLLPASSSPAAMVYGNDWVATKHAYICNTMIVLLISAFMLAIGVPLAQMLFHF